MTNNEAIQELKERISLIDKDYKNDVPEYKKVFETAVAALEKQIKRKLILDTIYHQQYYCPNCKDFLAKKNGDKPHHCTCGQAIEWWDRLNEIGGTNEGV